MPYRRSFVLFSRSTVIKNKANFQRVVQTLYSWRLFKTFDCRAVLITSMHSLLDKMCTPHKGFFVLLLWSLDLVLLITYLCLRHCESSASIQNDSTNNKQHAGNCVMTQRRRWGSVRSRLASCSSHWSFHSAECIPGSQGKPSSFLVFGISKEVLHQTKAKTTVLNQWREEQV